MKIHMRHYILTRFSIIFPEWRESQLLVNEERRRWFRYRAQMFRETLLKSVINQTRPVEKLILLMDSGDIDLYNTYLRGASNTIEPIFTVLNEISLNVEKFLAPNVGQGISVSRVDSDDILACDYIEQKLAHYEQVKGGNGRVCIVADRGYRSNLHYIQRIVDSNPPFISVFYNQYPGELDMGGSHLEIAKLKPIFCHDANWLQLLHDSNVGNLFLEDKIKKINKSNWPRNIHRPDPKLIEGYVLNSEKTRSVKRRVYALMLRTQLGVWVVKYLRSFSR